MPDADDITPDNMMSILDAMINTMQRQESRFRQPHPVFSVYDAGAPSIRPDISTPMRKAAVEFENRIRNEDREHGALFSAHGEMIQQTVGNEEMLGFTLDEMQKNRIINGLMTHNHPSGYTFSIEDIESACYFKLDEIRVVTRWHRYRMQFHGNWKSKIVINESINLAKPLAREITRMMVTSSVIGVPDAHYEASHQTWLIVARYFGWTYTQEKS